MKQLWCVFPFACVLAVAAPTFEELSTQAEAALDRRPAEAVTLYQQALQLRPKWAEGWFYLGASLSQLRRYAEARDALQKGIPLDPSNGTAWAFLGLSEYELGNYPRALENIQRAQQLGMADNPPFHAEVRARAALVHARASEFEQALVQLQPVAQAGGPKLGVVLDAAGLASLRIPKSPRDLSPEDRAFVHAVGNAAFEFAAQHPAEAKSAFDGVLASYSDRPGVHYLHGMFLLESNPDAALAAFRRETEIDSKNAFAHIQTALILVQRGEAAPAVAVAKQAVALDSRSYFAHTALGRAQLGAGQVKESVISLQTAAKLAPGIAQTQFYLEQAYRRAGRTQEALKAKAEFQRLKAATDPLSQPAR